MRRSYLTNFISWEEVRSQNIDMLFAMIHEIITLLMWYGCLSNTCIAVRTGVASESFGDLPNKPIDIVLKEILKILGVFA